GRQEAAARRGGGNPAPDQVQEVHALIAKMSSCPALCRASTSLYIRHRQAWMAGTIPGSSPGTAMTRLQRRGMKFFAATIVGLVLLAAPAAAQQPSFNQFIQSLWPEAQKIGVSRKTFDAETRGLTPDLSLPDLEIPGRVERPPAQAEFVQTPEQYVSEALIARFALQGKQY